MSLLDSTFLRLESRQAPMHVATLEIFQIPEGARPGFVRDIVRAFRAPGPLTKPFGLVLARGRLSSVNPSLVVADDVDLEYHVRHSALPAPGGERELGELVSRLHAVKLDRSRPLWTCHVIEGLEGGRFAIYIKIHHALSDGIGALRLFSQCLANDEDSAWSAPWHYRAEDSSQTPRRSGQLRRVLQVIPPLARGFAGLITRSGSEPVCRPFQAPISALNGHVTAARRVATQQLDLDRVKSVARQTDTSVNDVFLAVCSAALRRHLDETGLLPDSQLIAGVPVSLRQPGEMAANAVGFTWAGLATDLADPRARLAAIHDSMQANKTHLQKMPPAARTAFTLLMMTPVIAVWIAGLGARIRPPMNVVISNVPGPKRALYLNGARLEALYPVSIAVEGQALNVTCVSYDGKLNIGFTGCRDSLPHLQRLAVYAGEALDELEASLAVQAAAA